MNHRKQNNNNNNIQKIKNRIKMLLQLKVYKDTSCAETIWMNHLRRLSRTLNQENKQTYKQTNKLTQYLVMGEN